MKRWHVSAGLERPPTAFPIHAGTQVRVWDEIAQEWFGKPVEIVKLLEMVDGLRWVRVKLPGYDFKWDVPLGGEYNPNRDGWARTHNHAFYEGQVRFFCSICDHEVFAELERTPPSFNPLAGLGVEILSVLEIHPDGAVLKVKVRKS